MGAGRGTRRGTRRVRWRGLDRTGRHALKPLDRRAALAAYGPTTGDRIRLADSDLWVRVAEDRQALGDQPMWGYGRTMRARMAQSDAPATA
ncbi:MAG: hypothetical protein ABIZ34_08785, partial [Candidatus Limnocylindrales bacterium]